MRRLLNPLLLWFAQAHYSELIRQLQYLKVENQILRGKLGRQVQVTPSPCTTLFGIANGERGEKTPQVPVAEGFALSRP